MGRGQGKNFAQALAGCGLADGAAGRKRVFGKGGFDVHGQMDVGMAGQQRGQNVRAQAVGIDFDRQARGGNGDREADQTGDQRRFAAADHQPVEPAFVGGHKAAHGFFGQGRRGLRRPGQGGVMAMGAAQVAAAEKDHGGQPSRPVAQGHGLNAAHELPSRQMCHFVNNASVMKFATLGPLPNAPRRERPQHSPKTPQSYARDVRMQGGSVAWAATKSGKAAPGRTIFFWGKTGTRR